MQSEWVSPSLYYYYTTKPPGCQGVNCEQFVNKREGFFQPLFARRAWQRSRICASVQWKNSQRPAPQPWRTSQRTLWRTWRLSWLPVVLPSTSQVTVLTAQCLIVVIVDLQVCSQRRNGQPQHRRIGGLCRSASLPLYHYYTTHSGKSQQSKCTNFRTRNCANPTSRLKQARAPPSARLRTEVLRLSRRSTPCDSCHRQH